MEDPGGAEAASKWHRPLFFPCFYTFYCSKRPSFNFFAIPLDFDHPKTYITSKQTRIKAFEIKIKAFKSKFKTLKSKLKQVKKTKQKDMD